VENLARAGFKNVDTLTDGFVGDKVKDKKAPNYRKRTKNGWRHAGVPWPYDLDTNPMYLPQGKPKAT
jgi:hypothetical protein